jgi:hypothetical protein
MIPSFSYIFHIFINNELMRNIMKHRAPELGVLSSRYFAHVQLKGKEIIRTGELAAVLGCLKYYLPLHRKARS